MTTTVSSKEAIDALDVLLRDRDESSDVTIVERDGDPIAVVISIAEYRNLVNAQTERDWIILAELRERNRDKDPEQIECDIAEAIQKVRAERRKARQQASWGSS